ncbi:MAG: hypothetical protein AABZ31_14355 [Bdellovibrionota bacterium]
MSEAKSKKFYSYPHDTKAIAFIDIVGFGALTKKFATNQELAQLVFVSHENCILHHRASMKTTEGFKREVPTDLNMEGHKQGFWYKEVPDGSVNFIYLSDSVLLYSSSVSHLVRELSSIVGAAVVFGVPMRAVITVGDLEHSEWIERPGSAICLYGSALTKAVELEKSMSGKCMRVWLDHEVVDLMKKIEPLKRLIEEPSCFQKHSELKWWEGALQGTQGRTESQELKYRFDRWFSEKHPKDWFAGENKKDAERSVAHAVAELQKIGR